MLLIVICNLTINNNVNYSLKLTLRVSLVFIASTKRDINKLDRNHPRTFHKQKFKSYRDRINIRFMARERLLAHPVSYIPQLHTEQIMINSV